MALRLVETERDSRVYFDDREFYCPSCQGVGLYSGMGESKTNAVICNTCDGKGLVNFIRVPFGATTKRPPAPHLTHVSSPITDDPPRRKITVKEWQAGKKP